RPGDRHHQERGVGGGRGRGFCGRHARDGEAAAACRCLLRQGDGQHRRQGGARQPAAPAQRDPCRDARGRRFLPDRGLSKPAGARPPGRRWQVPASAISHKSFTRRQFRPTAERRQRLVSWANGRVAATGPACFLPPRITFPDPSWPRRPLPGPRDPPSPRAALPPRPPKPPRRPARTAKPAAKRTARPAKPAPRKAKWVYTFGDGKAEGRAEMRNLLGGKGANLAEMANLGLPVPPGFTITTEVCTW